MLIVDGTARRKLQKLQDPRWFIPRFMVIVDMEGRKQPLPLTAEQWEMLDALIDNKNVLALKSRQLGMTTLVLAFLFHRALLLASDQYNVLTMTHEQDAMYRANLMLKTYWENLPASIRPKPSLWNTKILGFDHNGTIFKQLMAGGRSQGRAYTYQALHATEMGFWPRGSAATGNKSDAAAEGADNVAWASALSTLHDSALQRVVIESTANGPTGVFYERVRTARESNDWAFLFFPWFNHHTYRRTPSPDWERTDEEQQLAELYDLTDEQLAWRRWKIVDQGYGLQRFRKEYPGTWEEPFLLADGMWFDVERLNLILAGIPKARLAVKEGERVYLRPEPGRKYYAGVDPSGGVGRDAGVIQILRDDWAQAATFSSKKLSPTQLADQAAKMAGMFNRARILCEENNHGKACLYRLRALRCHLWLDPKGRDLWVDTTMKRAIMDHTRDVVDRGYADLNDPLTIQELLKIREQRNGKIEADEGYNDDHVSALACALWNARESARLGTAKALSEQVAAQRAKRHRELGLG